MQALVSQGREAADPAALAAQVHLYRSATRPRPAAGHICTLVCRPADEGLLPFKARNIQSQPGL